ncbi:hypothetical protein F5Y11DRAFT_139343 [Daldinia sp. FL1419]|nr:hypothetical protein F5Y11DRAFT_139343 [Daldinia sp. FL1419]
MRSHIPLAYKVRATCDSCYKAKIKCSRGDPCVACTRSGNQCHYSISNRLGRPPKGASRGKIVGAPIKTPKLSNHSYLHIATAQSPENGQSQQDESISLDSTLVNQLSDSSYTPSTPETVPSQGCTSLEGNEAPANLYPIRDDQEPWMALDQLQQSPIIRAKQINATQGHAQRMYNNGTLPNHGVGYESKPTHCKCLQHHAQFLCHLKEVDQVHGPHFIVITLDMANKCLHLWKSHMDCHQCWGNEDHSALQLLLISIGMVVKRVWGFLTFQQPNHMSAESLLKDNELALDEADSSRISLMGAGKEYTDESGAANCVDNLQHDPKGPLITAPPMKITVDEFQVPEEEKMFIIGMLIIRMLTRIKEGLGDVRNRITKRQDEKSGICGSWYPLCGLAPLILDNLDESVLELEQSLRNLIMP